MDHETLSFESDGFFNHKIELGSHSSEKNISMISEIIESMIMGGLTDIYIEEEVEEIELMGDMIEVSEKGNTDAVIIQGTIKDEDGLVLPGVNIFIEGTNIGTQSDFDGNYSLEVEANQTLQFSYIGYITKSISVSNISNYINVNLELNAEFMGEVIITGIVGYGDYEPVVPPPNAADMDAQGKARKLSFKNGREFKRIQNAREKAARKLKRSQRK